MYKNVIDHIYANAGRSHEQNRNAVQLQDNRAQSAVQKKQADGLVNRQPTMQMKGKVNINANAGLEKEADVMGAKAASVANQNYTQQFKVVSGLPAAPVQRKIMVNDRPYTPAPTAGEAVIAAAQDEYVRHYKSVEEMNADLVSATPTSFGLIAPRALWYNLPYLTKEFFVYGESHAGVKGADIKHASHITKPIVNESVPGWNVNDAPDHEPVVDDKGLDENSSKLMRAIEAWKPVRPGAAVVAAAPGPPLPIIPEGEESVRETQNGTYRLVVKGDNNVSKLWQARDAVAPPPNTYNTQDQAYEAISGLFPKVFKKEIDDKTLDAYFTNLGKLWYWFGKLYDKDCLTIYGLDEQPLVPAWDNVAGHVRNALYGGAKKKVKTNYQHLHDNTHNAGAIFKAPDDPGLVTADDYRNEFILSAVLKAKQSNAYAFANMGNKHLLAIQSRLTAFGIPYITMDDFYNRYSKVAVSLPSARLDTEVDTFLEDVKAARVVPTEERIQALLHKLDTKGYPVDGPLRTDLVGLFDLAKLHGFQDTSPASSSSAPSENEVRARELGFI